MELRANINSSTCPSLITVYSKVWSALLIKSEYCDADPDPIVEEKKVNLFGNIWVLNW